MATLSQLGSHHNDEPTQADRSGDLAALAHTLAMPIDEITAAIGDLIAYGHLQRISNGVYRLMVKPAR